MATISGEVRDENDDLFADCVVRAYRRDTGALLVAGTSSDGTTPIVVDADYPEVTLLLHCDGTDGSTTFTDNSPTPKTVTVSGNAHIEVDQSKFGGASAAFDGTGDYLSTDSNAAYNLNDGNWTIETWAYINSATYGPALCSRRTSGDVGWCLEANCLRAYINGGWSNSQISWTRPSLNAWHHYALVKNGTTITAYVDGVSVGSKTSVTSIQDQVTSLRIGVADGGGSEDILNGYIDEFRFTKGVARYTANFTPPAAAFPDTVSVEAKPLGEYTLTTVYDGEVNIIALDPDGGTTFNDLILRTVPV